MRIRATVAAVTGALALSALAVPAAQADNSAVSWADAGKLRAAAVSKAGSAKAAVRAAAAAEITFSDVKVNNGKAIPVGITKHVAVPSTFTVTHSADVALDDFLTGAYIYKGSFDEPDNWLLGVEQADCTPTSATTASCAGDVDIFPGDDELLNSDAGSWTVGALAVDANDGSLLGDQGGFGKVSVQRYSKLTVNASPEPVKKGKTITVTGALTRANWETHKYAGYTVQPVKLQFKKKGTTSYVTVKTVTSSSTGALKTTVKAAADGYFRYSFAGTSTTPAVSAAGDFVDVQ
ncbi:hypothetical protein [Streptomyces fructofermentans]|uniref:Calcium-binding protein n=1 Tax=Streptomyces fructofermentans TaxID=152141 RepID=A0A918K3C4_9ACTN|nr:hypothetical protein [Streptomyces fructofermentans]GGX46882.1 hypothetical protein GCM10010515_12310 [Streptomyces fructofermentans]